jgi:mono/diheme cytochrome c family protein
MKRFMFAAVALVMMTSMAMAEDGAALYSAKCAGCHGAAGAGKSAPAIKGKANVVDVVTKGGLKGIHAKPINGVTADQAAAIATYLK